MHEVSLARRLVELGLSCGHEGRVRTLRGTVAESEQLSHAALTLHFEAYARGTPLEGARLDLSVVHLSARCAGCGEQYRPEHHLLMCPRCGRTDGELLGEPGVRIDSVEVESTD